MLHVFQLENTIGGSHPTSLLKQGTKRWTSKLETTAHSSGRNAAAGPAGKEPEHPLAAPGLLLRHRQEERLLPAPKSQIQTKSLIQKQKLISSRGREGL